MINKILPTLLFLHFSLFVISCSSNDSQVNKDAIGMENLIGLDFTQSERDTLLPGLRVYKGQYDTLRTVALDNSVPVPLYFDPRLPGQTLPTAKDTYLFQEFRNSNFFEMLSPQRSALNKRIHE